MKNRKFGKYYMHYKRNGKPYTGPDAVDQWAKDFDKSENKIVKQENTNLFGLFWVSTVWLGLNHSFGPNEPPKVFETMVFCRFPFPGFRHSRFQGCSDLDMARYSTEKQAFVGHQMAVAIWNNPVKIIEHLWDHLFREY